MKTKRSGKLQRFLLTVLTACMILMLASCGAAYKDYTGNEDYKYLFSEDDDEWDVELKNALIGHIEAYNEANPEAYYEIFNMSDDDLAYNIASFRALSQACRMKYTLESIDTAFINEENAQALMTMIAEGEDPATGELMYRYRRVITYTLVKNGKKFIVKEQSDEEMVEDLMAEQNGN